MNISTAVLFDGISSRPQPVSLELDEEQLLLQIKTDAGKYTLHLNDAEVETKGGTAEIKFRQNSFLQILKVSDKEFIDSLKKIKKSNRSFYQLLTALNVKSYILIA